MDRLEDHDLPGREGDPTGNERLQPKVQVGKACPIASLCGMAMGGALFRPKRGQAQVACPPPELSVWEIPS
jgi:hypothetical protein